MRYKIADVRQVLQEKDFEVFVHGCNLQGAFAAGIAGVVRYVYPECYNVYTNAVESLEYKGGQMVPYEIKDDPYCWDSFEDYLVLHPNKSIANLAIDAVKNSVHTNYYDLEQDLMHQFPEHAYNYTHNQRPVNKVILNAFTQIHPGPNGSYDFIDKAFSTIGKIYDCKISFPLIGCGIGGLHWNTVKEIIDYRLEGMDYECIVRMEDIEKYGLLNN